jgi:hypothetical protein
MLCAATTATPEPFAMSPGGLPVLPELLPLPEPLEPPLLPVLPPLPLPPELPDPPALPLALPEVPLESAPELPPLPALDPVEPGDPPVLLPLVPVLTPLEPVPAPLPLLDPVVAVPDEPLLPPGDESDDELHAAAANERARDTTERMDFMVGHCLRGSHARCGSTTDRKVVTRRTPRGSTLFGPRGPGLAAGNALSADLVDGPLGPRGEYRPKRGRGPIGRPRPFEATGSAVDGSRADRDQPVDGLPV